MRALSLKKREDITSFLYHHPEWEHLEMDIQEKFNTNDLDALTSDQLRWCAEHYNYYDN